MHRRPPDLPSELLNAQSKLVECHSLLHKLIWFLAINKNLHSLTLLTSGFLWRFVGLPSAFDFNVKIFIDKMRWLALVELHQLNGANLRLSLISMTRSFSITSVSTTVKSIPSVFANSIRRNSSSPTFLSR